MLGIASAFVDIGVVRITVDSMGKHLEDEWYQDLRKDQCVQECKSPGPKSKLCQVQITGENHKFWVVADHDQLHPVVHDLVLQNVHTTLQKRR